MPVMSQKWNGYPASGHELRGMLGLGHKIGRLPGVLTQYVQGYRVTVLTPEIAARGSTAAKPHRIRVKCKICGNDFSAGRLAQHEPACERNYYNHSEG